MKKIIGAVSTVLLVFLLSAVCYAENINVHITVTDVTDANEMFNMPVPRQSLSVSDIDLSVEYGGTFTGVETADGITYLHALAALHEELYGAENVSDYMMLDSQGETHYFMGNSIDSILYKQNNDIITLPQNVLIQDGDELDICIYSETYQQLIATFDKAKVENVAIGEEVELVLSEYYEEPIENNPIAGAEIADENGILLCDEDGNMIITDDDGRFSVSYDSAGTYIVSMMPQFGYYIEGLIEEQISYVPEVVSRTYAIPEGEMINIYDLPAEVRTQIFGENPEYSNVVWVEWDDSETDTNTDTDADTVELPYTTTVLTEVVTYIADDPESILAYTVPHCVIEVTDKLVVDDVSFNRGEENDTVDVTLKNAEADSCTVWCAAYKDGRMTEVQSQSSADDMQFTFESGNDYYKVMFWDGMFPKTEAYTDEVE